MQRKPDEPPILFLIWLVAGMLSAGTLLALVLAHG